MNALAGRIMLAGGPTRAAIAFGAGAIGVLALAPVDFFAAMFVSFPVLVWLLDGASGDAEAGFFRRLVPAFRIGWCFGFGYFVAGLWWLGSALLVDAQAFAWALPLAVLGLPAVLALFYGLAAAAARLLWSDGLGRIAALSAGFGLAEWLRAVAFTGFPWNAVGYAAMPVPVMMQSVHVLGMHAVTALSVFVFAAPALIATRRGAPAGLALAGLLAAAHLGYGWISLAGAAAPARTDGPTVRIVQPAVDQSVRWAPEEASAIFDTQLAMSAGDDGSARADIVIWPETAIPFLLTSNPGALRRIADTLGPGQRLVAGAVRAEAGDAGDAARYYNSIYVIDDAGEIAGAADKNHLVPFGEYLPFEGWLRRLGVTAVAEMPGGYSARMRREPLALSAGLSAWPLICYEAIFPRAMPPADGPGRPDLLLNLTNDAWFGVTPGPHQHFRQARIRAVETGLPMIRVANTGISAAIDGYGRVVAGLSLEQKGTVDTTLPIARSASHTRIGHNAYFWLIVALLILVGAVSRKSLEAWSN